MIPNTKEYKICFSAAFGWILLIGGIAMMHFIMMHTSVTHTNPAVISISFVVFGLGGVMLALSGPVIAVRRD